MRPCCYFRREPQLLQLFQRIPLFPYCRCINLFHWFAGAISFTPRPLAKLLSLFGILMLPSYARPTAIITLVDGRIRSSCGYYWRGSLSQTLLLLLVSSDCLPLSLVGPATVTISAVVILCARFLEIILARSNRWEWRCWWWGHIVTILVGPSIGVTVVHTLGRRKGSVSPLVLRRWSVSIIVSTRWRIIIRWPHFVISDVLVRV